MVNAVTQSSEERNVMYSTYIAEKVESLEDTGATDNQFVLRRPVNVHLSNQKEVRKIGYSPSRGVVLTIQRRPTILLIKLGNSSCVFMVV